LKTLLMAAAMAVGVGGALVAPAFAQPYPADAPPPPPPPSAEMPGSAGMMEHADRPDGGWSLDRREEWLHAHIDRASERGRLSGNEEERGRGELEAIRAEEAKLRDRDGGRLSPEDRTYVANRIDNLARTLRWQGENPPPPWSDHF
jgi:hypothetical protein